MSFRKYYLTFLSLLLLLSCAPYRPSEKSVLGLSAEEAKRILETKLKDPRNIVRPNDQEKGGIITDVIVSDDKLIVMHSEQKNVFVFSDLSGIVRKDWLNEPMFYGAITIGGEDMFYVWNSADAGPIMDALFFLKENSKKEKKSE